MRRAASRLELLDGMVSAAARLGIAMQTAEDESFDGRTLRIAGRDLVNFGSCSYLGLEVDPRLKSGAIDAVMRYGTELSSSRTYVSAPLYGVLEDHLESIFGAPVVVAPTTTLAHLSGLPILIDERDAVILDHQVHNSVQMAANQLRVQGTHVELLRHSRMDRLDDRVSRLARDHRHVWYLADGVYSMFGDFAPVEEISALLDRHPQMHFYVDDAHGMSWCGPRGSGYVLSRVPLHSRMVLSTGLAKGFGTGGGVLVFPDEELRRQVRTCAGPMIFSGPLQPPVLGAAIASARIHLSQEINELQCQLRDRIELCNTLLADQAFPVLSSPESPVRFVGMGPIRVAQNMTARLMEAGYFTNVAQFPATPIRRAGSRFMLNRRIQEDDLRGLADALKRGFPLALRDEGETVERVWRAFGLDAPETALEAASVGRDRGAVRPSRRVRRRIGPGAVLSLEVETSIEKISAKDWDHCLGNRGAFSWQGLRFLEDAFRGNQQPGNDWRFHYYRVVDRSGRTRLATFFTESLWKADMLAPGAISRELEQRRQSDPLHLTSRAFAMGSLLTEGNHLFLSDPVASSEGREALVMMLDAVRAAADQSKAEMLVLRDLPADDPDLDGLLRERGFVRAESPEALSVELDGVDEAEFVSRLSKKARKHYRREVLPWNEAYEVEVLGSGMRAPTEQEFEHFHRLYRNVKERSFTLNTFALPQNLFHRIAEAPGWELLVLRRASRAEGDASMPVAVVACYVGIEQYVPTVIGLDYGEVRSRSLYRQCLRRLLERARELGLARVLFGMGASLEKRRFGAHATPSALYVQAEDHYALDVIAQMRVSGD